MTTVAALYARVSTPNQEEEATIDSQIAAVETFIHKQGYQLSAENYFLDKAVSGARLERPALDRLRHVASDGILSIVVCYSPDRLARNYAHQLVILDELKRNGVQVEFVNQPDIGDNPQAHLLLGIQGLFAEYERAIIKERLRLGRLYKLRSGQAMHPSPPYGYRYIPVSQPGGGQWVVDEPEAAAVRQIYAWYTGDEKVTIWQIKERLDKTHPHCLRQSKRWAYSTVQSILQHTAYIGYTYFNRDRILPETIGTKRKNGYGRRRSPQFEPRPKEEWIKANTIPIIEEAIWHQAQTRMKTNLKFAKRNNTKHFYLLRGLLVCGTCGHSLQGQTQNGRKYYYCEYGSRKRHLEVPAHKNRQNGVMLEELVWQAIADLLRDPQRIAAAWESNEEQSTDLPNELTRLQKRQQQLEKQWVRLLDLFQDGLIAKSELSKRKEKLDHERQANAVRIEKIERVKLQEATQAQLMEDFAMFCTEAEKMVENPSKEVKQEVLRLLVEHIVVTDDEITIKHIIPHDDNYRLQPRDNMMDISPRFTTFNLIQSYIARI